MNLMVPLSPRFCYGPNPDLILTRIFPGGRQVIQGLGTPQKCCRSCMLSFNDLRSYSYVKSY